jgi:hypothetical protein
MSEEEEEAMMELGDSNLEFDGERSKEGMLVFKIRDVLFDDLLGLGKTNVMFRGEDEVMAKVHDVYLAIEQPSEHGDILAAVSRAKVDDTMEDVRVLYFPEWHNGAPFPLAGLSNLFVVIHGDIEASAVKFGADIVSLPSLYSVHQKLRKNFRGSGIRINHGRLSEIEFPIDATKRNCNIHLECSRLFFRKAAEPRVVVLAKREETWHDLVKPTVIIKRIQF